MPTPGLTVFETLKRALAEVQQQAAAAHDEARRIDQQMADLVTRRSEAMLELARLALPELTRAAVDSGFAEVRQDLLTILERKERRAKEVGDRIERLRTAAAAMKAKVQDASDAAKGAAHRQEQSRSQLARSLEQNVEFQTLSAQALRTEAELKRDEERVVEIANEAREKLPAYDASRLFRYLKGQRYGTAEYAGRGLVRRLDRWVGRLVEFEKASRSYRFLLTTPALMDAETARRKTEFHSLMQRLEDMERMEAERLELPQAIREVESTKATLQRLEGQLAEDDQRVRTAEEELAALDREQGQFHEEALGRLKVFLSQAETPLLERRAAATPDRADDEVTLRIRVLSEEIAEIEPQLARQKQMSASASRLSDGLGHLARRFEQANFHESRSFFADGYDIARSMELYRTEVLSRDAFWDEIKRQQERVPTDFEKRASETIAAAMNGPMSGALAEAMLNVAGAALGQSVGRSMSRRRAVGDGPGPAEHGKRWVRKDPPEE